MPVMSSFPTFCVCVFFLSWERLHRSKPFTRMALAHSPGARIPVHSLRAPACCISTKLVENYKHTQGHCGAEPASHRAHLIQPETQQLPPSVCLRVGLQLFHYLFEQIGLRLVCGGLIVTRDEGLQSAGCCGPDLLSHSAVSDARLISCLGLSDSSTFPGHWSVTVLTYAICSAAFPPPIDGEMCWLVCVNHFWENIHSWDHKKHLSVISSEPWLSHLTAFKRTFTSSVMKAFSVALKKIVTHNTGGFHLAENEFVSK